MFPSTNMTAIFIAMQKIMTALQNSNAMELLQKVGYVVVCLDQDAGELVKGY